MLFGHAATCFALFCFVSPAAVIVLDSWSLLAATGDKRQATSTSATWATKAPNNGNSSYTHTHQGTHTHILTHTHVFELCCVSLTVCWCLPRFVLAFARLTQSPLLFTFLLHFTFIVLSSCIKHSPSPSPPAHQTLPLLLLSHSAGIKINTACQAIMREKKGEGVAN